MAMQCREIVFSVASIDFFSSIEKNQHSPHRRICIDGRITGSGNTVGYCRFKEHPGYLTKALRKEHDCVKKGCYYYSPKSKAKESVTASNPFAILAEAF